MTTPANPPKPARAKARARDRGRSFEYRLAEMGDGTLWSGTDGDIELHGHRTEAKYRAGLTGLRTLARFIEQAQANGKQSDKPWALALTGGKSFQNGAVFVVIPWQDWHAAQSALALVTRFNALSQTPVNQDRWQVLLAAVQACLSSLALGLAADVASDPDAIDLEAAKNALRSTLRPAGSVMGLAGPSPPQRASRGDATARRRTSLREVTTP